MNLYQLASQDEAWGAYAPDDDTTPLSAWFADPPAPVPPGPVPIDAALDAAAREYGVNAEVLRALGPGSSVDSIFDTAASLRSRLEAFGGDYAQALASYRQAEDGSGGNALAAPAVAPPSPPPSTDARIPAPGPTAGPAPSSPRSEAAPRPRPARPQATAPLPGRLPPRSARQDGPPAPADGRLDSANDPRSLVYRPPPAVKTPLVEPGAGKPTPASVLERSAPPPATRPASSARDAANPRVLANTPDRRAPAAPAGPASPPQRSWGDAFSDATKSAAQGILDVASLPGVAYSAITGDYDTAYLNAIRGTQEVLQDEKSPAFQAQAQALQQKLATAEGWREKLAVGGWETLKNPTLLGDTLARSAPGMLAGGVLGRAAGGAADAAGNALLGRTIATGSEAAARSAVALKNAAPAIASGTAVGASAAQQGASVANDLYTALRKLPASAFAAEPEFQQLAREHGPDKARDILAAAATNRALLVSTGASVLSMKLMPGGDAIEKAFLPSHLKGSAAREAVKSTSFLTQPLTRGMEGSLGTQALEIAVQGLRHGTTGSLAEGAEEASGAVARGLELSRAGQDVKLDDMAGEAAGQAMAAGFAMDGAAGTRGTKAAPRVQDQPTWPSAPPAPPAPPTPTMARGRTEPEAHATSGPPPAPSAATPSAAPPGYSEALQPDSKATWSDLSAAAKKAQAETEILRKAEALPAQDAAPAVTAVNADTADTTTPAAPSTTPAADAQRTTTDSDQHSSGNTPQGANARPQPPATGNARQADTSPQATATDPAAGAASAPAPTPPTAGAHANADAHADGDAADTAPTATQHGTARHTAAAQVQPPAPAPINAQIQALDSGMLVIGGDQATILAHLQAGGVRGAEPFMGTTIVPVDQAALAQRVLSRPLAATAAPQAGTGSRRAPATANQAQASAAAQPAPASHRGATPTAGSDSTAGPITAGASAPRTGHRSPANAANAGAFHPVPVMEMQRDGTLMVKGDSVQLEERLRQGGVDSVLRRKGGVLVGLDQVSKARKLLQQSARSQASASPSLPSLPSQQFKRGESLLQDGSYAAPTSKAEDGSSPASRYSNRSTPPKAELSLERIDQVIQETLAGLAGAPPVKAVGSPGDIGLVVPAEVVASGITLGSGDIYVFQSGVGSDLDVRLVVFHELLHRGVRFLVPRAQYVQTMLDLAARDTRVQQYANEWKRTGIVPQQREQLARLGYKGSELQGQLEAMAIEEGLARISEELNVDVSMGTRWKPSRIRALAQWLATVADKAGMAKLAQAIRAMTYNEAERFVMRAIDHAGAAGGDIENSGRARSSTRSPQNPWTQPVDSARLEMQRDGTLMVKGDPVQLEERLRQGGVDSVLLREGGVLVGLDQVDTARQWLQQSPRAQDLASPSLPPPLPGQGQQFSRNAPDRASQTKGLPSQPATVQSVKAAVAKLTNSMGLLAEGRGRVVVATSADIKAHWEPLVGDVDMGSQDTGLAQGFYDPETKTVFLIADHIEAGQEMAVAAHELVHKHGRAVLGEARWRQLHEVIGSWANKSEGSLERRVYDEATARVKASRPKDADAAAYSSEELFPYAVEVAMELGVQPTALMPINSVRGWLARVRASLQVVLGKLTGNPQAFDGQDLVDLAFGIAQQERAEAATVQWQGDVVRPTGGSASPSTSYPSSSSPPRPLQMSRDAGKDGAGTAKEKGPLGSENNPRPVPLTDFKVRILADDHPSNAITMLVDGEDVDFASIEIKNGSPVLVVGKNGKKESGEHVVIDAHGVTKAMLKAVISYYIETKGGPPAELPGSLAYDNLENFQKEFDKHREKNHNGTMDDWAQAAIRDISFGKARQKLGYGVFEIKLLGSVSVGDLKNVPEDINIIARRY